MTVKIRFEISHERERPHGNPYAFSAYYFRKDRYHSANPLHHNNYLQYTSSYGLGQPPALFLI